jgi:hypothetical protein
VSRLSIFTRRFPLIGMVHLGPLPGSPLYEAPLSAIIDAAERDARALCDGGIAGLLVENYGDTPFFGGRVPPVTVATMAVVVSRIVAWSPVPVGVQVLRNDARGALAVAVASGALFLRVNVFAGVAVAGEGLLRGDAAALLRERRALGADVAIWADFRAKHAAPLGARSDEVELAELAGRAHADAIVVSGEATGAAPDPAALARIRAAARDASLVLGSGLSAENAGALIPHVDAAIVGTSVKRGGVTTNPVDPASVRALVEAVEEAAP